ncbi:MAG: GNAT family N-acetyltransferase [Chloroflexota bacterium]
MEERIRELRKGDIADLTRMWNGADPIWPGGLTSGMPLTVDRVHQWVTSTEYIAPFVAVKDGHIVGFCGLTRAQGEPDVAYVAILGVHPAVLNQGYGRDLLRAAIARSTLGGFRRLDLDTWSANDLAIPLYKRTGFFWVPGTSVNMRSFLPLLLRNDLVRGFLGEADWYPHLRSALTMAEDTYNEGGLPVFPYVFEKGDRRQRFALDVGTGEVIAYEDDEVRLGLTVLQPRLVLGAPTTVSCGLERKDAAEGRLAPFSLFVEGRGGLEAARALAGDVERSVRVEIEAVATRPALDTFGASEANRPGFAVQVAIGGKALAMGASLPVVPGLEVFAEPEQFSLAPDRPGRFWLGVRSNLPFPATARLQLTTCGDFAVRPLSELEFALAAGASAAAEVEVEAPAGLHSLRAVPLLIQTNETELVEAGMLEVPVVAGGPSDVFAYRTAWGAVLENAHLRALITAKGGAVRLQTKNPAHDLVEQRATIGPPFWPAEFAYRQFELQVDARGGRASVHMAIESLDRPGLWFRRSVTLTASPRLETEFSLVNTADRVYALEVRAEHLLRLHPALVAVPLSEGLLVDSAEAADWEGGARFPDCYAETWSAYQREDLTVGFLWPENSLAEFSRRSGPAFTLPEVSVGPGQTVDAGRVVLFGGAGGWRTVRDQWRRLFNPSAPEQPPVPVRAAEVGLSPLLVAWSGEPVPLALHVRHLRGRILTGKASLHLPAGWQASAGEWEVEGLRRGQPRQFETRVWPNASVLAERFPAADEGTLVFDANLALGKQTLALLMLGRPDKRVEFRELSGETGPTVRVDNGFASFTVAPQFAASVVEFAIAGQNHLYSSFPTPGSLMWQRPWFGGLAPVVAPAGQHFHPIHAGRLHDERFEIDFPVSSVHVGATWTGVRLGSDLSNPAGVRLETEYLTLGGSNLLLAIVRLRNNTAAPQRVQTFLGCYLRLEGDVEHTVLRYLAEGEHNTRREAFDVWLAPSADWAALESERGGLTAALVSLTPWAYVQAYDLGLEGAHLFNVGEALLAPGQTTEYDSLLALTDSATKARRYRALGWSGEIGLPPEH